MSKALNSEFPSGYGVFLPNEEEKPPIHMNVIPLEKQRKYSGRAWFYVHQDVTTGVSLMEQAEFEKPLTQTEYRVRDMLLGSMGLGNWAIVNQSEIARRIRVQRADVSRAIKTLIERGIVIQGEKMGRNIQYMISPAFCFKGSMDEGQKLLRKSEKQHKAKVIQLRPTMVQGSLLPGLIFLCLFILSFSPTTFV
jgi:hypothetical protein